MSDETPWWDRDDWAAKLEEGYAGEDQIDWEDASAAVLVLRPERDALRAKVAELEAQLGRAETELDRWRASPIADSGDWRPGKCHSCKLCGKCIQCGYCTCVCAAGVKG